MPQRTVKIIQWFLVYKCWNAILLGPAVKPPPHPPRQLLNLKLELYPTEMLNANISFERLGWEMYTFFKKLFGVVPWQRGAVNTSIHHFPIGAWCKESVEVIQFGANFILVKHCFQENHNELFVKWEISFLAATALWLNMNKVEVVQGNRERCFPPGYECKSLVCVLVESQILFQTKLDSGHISSQPQSLSPAYLAALYHLDVGAHARSMLPFWRIKNSNQQPFINLADTGWSMLLYHLLRTEDQQHPLW